MKSIDRDVIKNEIQNGLRQVDSTFQITAFEANADKKSRKLSVNFSAQTASGTNISEVIEIA